jgi:hypothetical protein
MGLTTFCALVSRLRITLHNDGFAVVGLDSFLYLEVALIIVRSNSATGCA